MLGSVLVVVAIQQIIQLIEALITYSAVRARRALLDDLSELRHAADTNLALVLSNSRAGSDVQTPLRTRVWIVRGR